MASHQNKLKSPFKRNLAALFGQTPYLLIYKFIKLVGASLLPTATISARNSFALGYLEPGWSDIDLSLRLPEKFSQNNFEIFLKTYHRVQKILPLLGELNVYSPQRLEFILKYHNPFELSRNPDLTVELKFNRTANKAHGAVFLLRQCEKDMKNLSTSPMSRTKKWQYHWDQIQSSLDLDVRPQAPNSSELFVSTIVYFTLYLSNVRNSVQANDLSDKIILLLELIKTDFDFSKSRLLFVNESWMIAWWPQIFAQWNCPYIQLNPDQIEVFQRQIEWELCGVLSQPITDVSTVNKHIDRLKKLAATICDFSGDETAQKWFQAIFSDLSDLAGLDDTSSLE